MGIDIPKFIRHLRENDPQKALDVIREKNFFPAICGRICTAPCESACVLLEQHSTIGIRALERYAADFGQRRAVPVRSGNQSGKKVAVIGSGPAGLSAAVDLAQSGHRITIFESLPQPGGVLRYGIPEFRLPQKVLDAEIEQVKALGVEIKVNVLIGQTMSLQELTQQGYDVILLALGAGVAKFIDIPGTSLGGVSYAEEFLMRINLMRAEQFPKSATPPNIGSKVVVIGEGHAAFDCARLCLRMGRAVILLCGGIEEDMKVRSDERQQAQEEGLRFETLARPVEIFAGEDNFLRGLRCVRLDFAEGEEQGAWKLKAVPGSDFELEADTVILASGHKPNSTLAKWVPTLKCNRDGTLRTDKNGKTSLDNIFACGDVVTGAGTVVDAIASGKKAARQIQASFAGK